MDIYLGITKMITMNPDGWTFRLSENLIGSL